jgi:hypothetical protein
MNTVSTSGSGAITAAKDRDNINRDYGSFATYDIGKVLVAGGGDSRRREGVVAREAFDQNTTGVRGSAGNNDSFGQVLDSVLAGSTTQLEVGVAPEAIGTAADAGKVQLFSSNGIIVTPGVELTQVTTSVTGKPTAGDRFGRRLILAAPGLSDTNTRPADPRRTRMAQRPTPGKCRSSRLMICRGSWRPGTGGGTDRFGGVVGGDVQQ